MIHPIQFVIDSDPAGVYPDEIQIRINGRDFAELVREVELPFAIRDGSPFLAGGYAGLLPEAVYPPTRYFLGMPSESGYPYAFRTQLLQCGCGVSGCSPFFCRIEVGPFIVSWSDFGPSHHVRAGKHAWSYEKLGPFEFDRLQYEEALAIWERKLNQ